MARKNAEPAGPTLIEAWRLSLHLTKTEAARRLRMNPATYSRISRGALKPGRDKAVEISQIAGVPVPAWSNPS